jgi:transcriptional antiterminator RfaH
LSLKWYVARTKPLAEYSAASMLENSGVQVFAPCTPTVRPRVGHLDTPLFPGYLFLRCDLNKNWNQIHQVPQIWGFVKFEGEPCPVPDGVILALKHHVISISKTGGLRPHFNPGDNVRVIFGATESLAKVVKEKKSSQARVRVLMEFMGDLVPTDVPWQNLRPAESFPLDRRVKSPRRTRGKKRWVRGGSPETAHAVSSDQYASYSKRLLL